MSQKRKVYLADSAPEAHTIVFYRGKMVGIQCPKRPQSHATQSSPRKKRATTRGIPDEVKTHVATVVEHFNTTAIRNPHCVYVPRYKGKFLYLDRQVNGYVPVILRHLVKMYLLLIIRGVRKFQNGLKLLMERIISFGGARLLCMYIVIYIRNSILSLLDH